MFKIGLGPITDIKGSDLGFLISYRIPFLPIPFTEEHNFSAIKDSKVSIKWLHK
jgi:hypothetical protein